MYLYHIVLNIKNLLCTEFSIVINHQQTNGSEPPCHYIAVVSRRNNQTNFSDAESELDTH